LKELDKSIIRDPLTLTRPVSHPVTVISNIVSLASIKALQASFEELGLSEARHGRLVNERQGDGAPFSLKETASQRT
jgi:hypothetical protein